MPFYKMGNNIPVLNTSGTFLISKILLNVLVKIGAMMCLQLVKYFHILIHIMIANIGLHSNLPIKIIAESSAPTHWASL